MGLINYLGQIYNNIPWNANKIDEIHFVILKCWLLNSYKSDFLIKIIDSIDFIFTDNQLVNVFFAIPNIYDKMIYLVLLSRRWLIILNKKRLKLFSAFLKYYI